MPVLMCHLAPVCCLQFVMERLEGEAAEKEAAREAASQGSTRKAAAEHAAALQESSFPSRL